MTPVWTGTVRGGRLVPAEPARLRAYLAAHEGQPIELIIRRARSRRTRRANAYYWGVVVRLLAEHCGYDPAEMHEVLAMRLLRLPDCPLTGAPRRRRTSQLSAAEFARYVDDCIRLAAELGVVIPPPDRVEADEPDSVSQRPYKPLSIRWGCHEAS